MQKLIIYTTFLLFLFLQFIPQPVFAATFGLIAPTGQLTRGQEVTFTVTIDTQGESIETIRVGLQYEVQYLEFLNAIPGDTFSSISVEEIEKGKLVLTGNNDTPFSGEGVFAYVKFKLIAQAPGTTQLCSFFNPDTLTPTPTQAATPTPTTYNTPTPIPPSPTELPKSGQDSLTKKATATASIILIFSLAGALLAKLRFS